MTTHSGTVTVRPAVLADDAALLELNQRSWSASSGFPSEQTRERATFFNDRISPPGHLVAELDGKIVAMIAVKPKSRFPEAAHVFGLWNLVVAPEARRKGVASAILEAAERIAVAQGARKLSLLVLASNQPAIELYTNHGYAVAGRWADEFLINGDYVDELSLEKRLG